MQNKAILLGHVGHAPEIRTTKSGTKVANFSLATSESWRDKQTGDRKQSTEWHKVVVFAENLIDLIENYVKKGSKLYIEGAIRTRKYQDKNKSDRYATEIVLQPFDGNIQLLDKREKGGLPTPEDSSVYGVSGGS